MNDAIEYEKNHKRILTKIYLMTHPDITQSQDFTEKQLKLLLDYYNQTNEIRDNKIVNSKRSVDLLENILESVQNIWDNMGIDINDDTSIKGENIEEMINYLNKKINHLEEKEIELRNEMYTISNNNELNSKEIDLQTENNKKHRNTEFKKIIDKYEKVKEQCEKKVSSLFILDNFKIK